MSALMADHRDYADDERQPSLFDVLAPQPARPDTVEPQQPEGAQVVEFPRRPDVTAEPEAAAAPVVDAPGDEVPAAYLEPTPAIATEDAWLTELAPDVDEAELAMLAPVETELAPAEDVAREPRMQRAAGLPLAGPTLDDVVSRVWEGLVMRLPAACPASGSRARTLRGRAAPCETAATAPSRNSTRSRGECPSCRSPGSPASPPSRRTGSP